MYVPEPEEKIPAIVNEMPQFILVRTGRDPSKLVWNLKEALRKYRAKHHFKLPMSVYQRDGVNYAEIRTRDVLSDRAYAELIKIIQREIAAKIRHDREIDLKHEALKSVVASTPPSPPVLPSVS